MNSIFDLDYNELKTQITNLNIKPFIANQIFSWIYNKLETDSGKWTNIAKINREIIGKKFDLKLIDTEKIEEDRLGTKKFLFKLNDGYLIESVLIKETDHYTFCISSQVGCALKCAFCATGKMGFFRDLTSGEILQQILILKRELGNYKRKLNLVLMGMGEPLLNYTNVKKALSIITKDNGFNIAQRNISISTSGFIDKIKTLERDFPKIKISFSLNGPNQEKREALMPISKKEPIKPILQYFKTVKRQFRVTFEYVIIKEINDAKEDAKKLSELLRHIPCKINIIPYNENEAIDFKTPGRKKIEIFADILYKKGYTVTVRWSKGKEISSACGQLSADNKKRGA